MPAETQDPRDERITRDTSPAVRSIAAAIFDFDETMVDLEPQHTAAYEELCAALGCDYGSMPESFRNGSGRRVIDDIHELRAYFGWSEPVDVLFERRQEMFDRITRESPLTFMPGVRKLVLALHDAGIPLAIASSSVRASIEAILERLELRHCFRVIVDGSEVTHGKPHPEAYLVTAKRLGVTPGDCVVFEDSEVGVRAAKAAGAYCIAVRNPRALSRQDLSPADEIVESMTAIDAGRFRVEHRTSVAGKTI